MQQRFHSLGLTKLVQWVFARLIHGVGAPYNGRLDINTLILDLVLDLLALILEILKPFKVNAFLAEIHFICILEQNCLFRR